MLKPNLMLALRGQVKTLTVFSVFGNLLFLAFPLYSLQIYDRVLNTGSIATLLWLVLMVTLCVAASNLLGAVNGFCMINFTQAWAKPVREQIVNHTIQQVATRGRLQGSQLIRDVDTVKNYVSSYAFVALLEAPWGVLYLGMLFFIHPVLGGIALAGLALLLLFTVVNLLSVQRAAATLHGQGMENTLQIDRALVNAEAMHTMGMAGSVGARWQSSYLSLQARQAIQQKQNYMLEAFSRFTRIAIQIITLAAAAYYATSRELTAGSIMASSMLAARVFSPFEMLFANWQRMGEAKKAWERVSQALQVPTGEERKGIPTETVKGALSVENVVYGFSPVMAQMIIKGISFQLQPGEIMGIIGPVASGKSTLARLVLGTVPPVSGCVRLDGVDLRHYDRTQLGAKMGYVPQNIQLFPGSIHENIARLSPDADERDVIAAATMAGVHETILRMPEGYNTSAEHLSAGQAQLVALARAFYGAPKLLVLDEPDSALEPQSERIIAQALQNAKRAQMTTVIISHRRYMLGLVGRLMVLKAGTVEHFGTTREVLDRINGPARPGVAGRES